MSEIVHVPLKAKNDSCVYLSVLNLSSFIAPDLGHALLVPLQYVVT